MQLEAAKALYAELHAERPYHDGSFKSWAKERSSNFPFRFTDGLSFYMSPVEVNPDDQFLAADPDEHLTFDPDEQ